MVQLVVKITAVDHQSLNAQISSWRLL